MNTTHKTTNISYQASHIKVKIPSIPSLIINSGIEHYKLKELDEIKTNLNSTKSKFDKLDNYRVSKLLQQIDLYKDLRKIAKSNYNARHVTNAWLKFWELYYEFDIGNNEVIAFFNAELPGAAIESFNHYMKTIKNKPYNWVASSLVPDKITGNKGDALGDSYGLFEHNREHWLMNLPDENVKYNNNGDATIVNNLLDFSKRCGPKSDIGGVSIYTHDAGVDPSGDYNNQESTNMFVHLGCAIAGFVTLKKGGDFIGKQYTFFETLTWNLIILYATLFEEFYLSKPLTSRAANSEIYLIGKRFKGINEETLDLLYDKLKNKNNQPIIDKKYMPIIEDAVEVIVGFGKTIYDQQQMVLQDCLKLYNQNVNHNVQIKKLKLKQCNMWLSKYPIHKINEKDWLPSN